MRNTETTAMLCKRQPSTSQLAAMTREYWRALQVLRRQDVSDPCHRTIAIRYLSALARRREYGRLRHAAAGAVVNLQLAGTGDLGAPSDIEPVE